MTSTDDGLRNSSYWRERAEETRAKAGEMRSPRCSTSPPCMTGWRSGPAEREAKHKLD